jgi:FxsC-like protein
VSTRAGADQAPYFFLSYAHTAPLALDREPTDYWVAAVFEDLSAAVREAAGLDRQRPVGFFDGLLKASEDWKARVSFELGGANVFVPLYSARYFSMTWPGREWTYFTGRWNGGPAEDPRGHIVPVLWAPMAGAAGPPDRPDPLSLLPEVPEYAENGLRALKMLNHFREQYAQVISALAGRILGAAHEPPLGRAAASSIDQVASAFQYKGVEDDFVIAVAAPDRSALPADRGADCYGEEAIDWSPFAELGELRLAEHPLAVAERLSFNTSVVDVQEAADGLLATPGIVLIDPWIAAPSAEGENGESEALQGLRELYARPEPRIWALPVLVLNDRDPESTACQNDLVQRITRILEELHAPLAETSGNGEYVVTSYGGFDEVIPGLVAEAERRYLRYGPEFPNDLSGEGRPSSGGGSSSLDSDGWEQRDGSGA